MHVKVRLSLDLVRYKGGVNLVACTSSSTFGRGDFGVELSGS